MFHLFSPKQCGALRGSFSLAAPGLLISSFSPETASVKKESMVEQQLGQQQVQQLDQQLEQQLEQKLERQLEPKSPLWLASSRNSLRP